MSNGPDDKVGSGEKVSAVLIRADGSKKVIEEKKGLFWRLEELFKRAERLF